MQGAMASARLETPARDGLHVRRITETELQLGEEPAAALRGHVGPGDEMAAPARRAVVDTRTGIVEREEVDAHPAAHVRLPLRLGGHVGPGEEMAAPAR